MCDGFRFFAFFREYADRNPAIEKTEKQNGKRFFMKSTGLFSIRKKGVIGMWLITYVCLFLVLFALWAVIVGVSQFIVSRQSARINENVIEVLVSIVDENLTSIENLTTQMEIKDSIIRKTYNQFTTDGRTAYTSKEILDELAVHNARYSYVSDIFLWLPKSGYVISSGTVASSWIYYELNFSDIDLDQTEWEALLSEKRPLTYRSLTSDGAVSHVLLFTTVPGTALVSDNGRNYSTLVFDLNLKALQKIVQELAEANTSFIEIFDENGLLLCQAGTMVSGMEHKIQIVSEQTGWIYEMTVPSSVWFGQARYLIVWMSAALIAAFVLFCGLSLYFTKRNYNPLREMLESVKVDSSFDAYDGSEYAYLQETFAQVLEESRGAYVRRFLTGAVRRVEVDSKTLENLQLEWMLRPCLLLLLRPCGDWAADAEGSRQLADAKAVVRQTLKGCYSVFLNRMLVVLVPGAYSEEEQKTAVAGLDQALREETGKYDIAVSRFEEHGSISAAYDEAVYAMQYAGYLSEGRIVFYEDIREISMPRRIIYANDAALGEAVKKKDAGECLALMRQAWEANTAGARLRPSDLRFLLSMQMSSYFKIVCMLYPEFYRNGFPVDMRQISAAGSVGELGEILDQVVKDSFVQMQKYSADNKEERLKLEVTRYIEEHFTSQDLTAESVCRAFGKTPPYFSKLFKEASGMGLLDYINHRRVQEAKYLIRNQKGLSVNELAERTGFSGANTFIRVFKKYEGVTPGKYQEMIISQQREEQERQES